MNMNAAHFLVQFLVSIAQILGRLMWLSQKVTLSKLTLFFLEILTLLRVNKQKYAEFYQFCITCLPKNDET